MSDIEDITCASDSDQEILVAEDQYANLEAVKEECVYIKKVVQNFNTRLSVNSVEPDVRNVLLQFNSELSAMLIGNGTGVMQGTGNNIGQLGVDKGVGTESSGEPAAVGDMVRPLIGLGPCMTSSPGIKREGECRASFDPARDATGNAGGLDASVQYLVQALSSLDNRPTPCPEVYTEGSGQSFADFLISFEQFCTTNFRGGHTLWGGELGKYLEGDLLTAYKVLRVPGESYNGLKGKLTEWLDSSRDRLEHEAKEKFKKTSRNSSEPLRLYAARLEKCFRVAYPKRSVEGSKALREKYLDTVPGRFKDRILTTLSVRMSLNENEKDLGWSKIILMASQYDARDFSKQTGKEECLWVNENKSVNKGVCNDGNKNEMWKVSERSDGKDEEKRSVAERRGYARPPASRECEFCGITGHQKRDCRRWKNQCLVCGSDDHYVTACRDRRSRFRTGGFTEPVSGTRSSGYVNGQGSSGGGSRQIAQLNRYNPVTDRHRSGESNRKSPLND